MRDTDTFEWASNTPTYPLDHMNREPLIIGIQLQILDRCAQWVCHEVKMRFSAALLPETHEILEAAVKDWGC